MDDLRREVTIRFAENSWMALMKMAGNDIGSKQLEIKRIGKEIMKGKWVTLVQLLY